jgi:hypothetical protein
MSCMMQLASVENDPQKKKKKKKKEKEKHKITMLQKNHVVQYLLFYID